MMRQTSWRACPTRCAPRLSCTCTRVGTRVVRGGLAGSPVHGWMFGCRVWVVHAALVSACQRLGASTRVRQAG